MEFTKEMNDALLAYIQAVENKIDLVHKTQIELTEKQGKVTDGLQKLAELAAIRLETIEKKLGITE